LGTATAAFLRGFDQAGIDRDKTVLVNGIGCSGRTAAYLDFDVLKGTHGRAIAFATGIKLFRPDLNVVVMAGDGDTLAIGGNHFIHAARRDLDITVILFNNQIYGMTGGQVSPTTPAGAKASTAPTGFSERPFDACKLAEAAGASYVARATVHHNQLLTRLARNALSHQGFSLVEVISQCPQQYGRWNNSGTAHAMLDWQKEHAVRLEKAAEMSPQELADKFIIGEIVNH
jgi:2-oxoglutarate ferredoxin oxidoreductase subunit beta